MELEEEIEQLREALILERSLIRKLIEPTDPECRKIRLSSEPAAAAMSLELLLVVGEHTEPYRCRICPPQPLSDVSWWHVRHVNRRLGGRRGRAYRRRLQRETPLTHRMDLRHLLAAGSDTDLAASG
jgi:hypothetical protein